MVTITINTDNEAFEDNPEHEIAWLLENLSHQFKTGTVHDGTTKRDHNGNTVLTVKIKEA